MIENKCKTEILKNRTRNEGAVFAIKRAMEMEPNLKVTLPSFVDDNLFKNH